MYSKGKLNWPAIQNRSKRCKANYNEALGKQIEIELSEERKELYDEMHWIAKQVNEAAGKNRLEYVYQEWMAYLLQDYGVRVEVEKQKCITTEAFEFVCNLRLDIYIEEQEIIIELKTKQNIKGIEQLKNYMKQLNKNTGFLMQYVKGNVLMYMIYRENDTYYIYDGEVIYCHE